MAGRASSSEHARTAMQPVQATGDERPQQRVWPDTNPARQACPQASARSLRRRRLVSGTAAVLLTPLAVLISWSGATGAEAQSARPNFRLPFACHAQVRLTTYVGHNPDDKKIDMFRVGVPTGSPILASAAGLVHEQFYPGGIEIDHGNGWFTVYLHMSSHVPPGTRVRRGQPIGIMGNVGTGVTHLHYEQLHRPGSHDADNEDIVNPVLQGEGPIVMDPNHPFVRTSTNCGGPAAPARAPAPVPAPRGHVKYWVDTFANALGRATPGGRATGMLRMGRNYVYCKVLGPEARVGSEYNHWWLKTDLDVGPANQWVSAYYLTRWGNDVAKDNNGVVIPNC